MSFVLARPVPRYTPPFPPDQAMHERLDSEDTTIQDNSSLYTP